MDPMQQQIDPAEHTLPVPSTATVAAPAGPLSDGKKSALDGMAGPSVMPLQPEEVDPVGEIDRQRENWEAIEEERQLWDAHDEQHKLRKKEEKRQKLEERRQKQEDRKQKQDENKKIKLELAQRQEDRRQQQHERRQMQDENKKKKLEQSQKKEDKKKKKLELSLRKKELQDKRDKSTTDIHDGRKRMKRAEGGGSPQGVTRSPGVNYLKSRLGVLASAAASKRGRPLSDMDGSSPSHAKSVTISPSSSPSLQRSPSSSRSSSPAISPLSCSKMTHSRGRKVRRLTSDVWNDFVPHYNAGKLVQAECMHCNEVMAAGRDIGTSGVRRHLTTCPIRSDLHLIVDKLKSSVNSPHASVLKNWEFDHNKSRELLARMIVLDEMPFSIVQYGGFVEFVKSLNPLFQMISRRGLLSFDSSMLLEKMLKHTLKGWKQPSLAFSMNTLQKCRMPVVSQQKQSILMRMV